MILTDSQRAFFARNGFLQIPSGISPLACEQMVRWTEERLPNGWRSDRRETWTGTIEDACHANTLVARRGRLQYRVKELAQDPALLSSYGPMSGVAEAAQSLLGCELGPVLLRGLYPIFPVPDCTYEIFKKAHNEAHPSQLITVSYLRDVEPCGGGLLIWPGSHRAIYPRMASKLEYVEANDYRRTFEEWTLKEPLELSGRAGDVIIIHHRLLHAPSVNRTNSVRFGFLCDYRSKEFDRICREAPSQDLWEDWPAMRTLPRIEVESPSDFDLPPQATMSPASDARRELRKRTSADAATTKRKGDASILERLRRVGDRWLVLSDSPTSERDWKLFPRGSDLQSQGTRVLVNGMLTESISQYDHILEIKPTDVLRELRIENLQSPAWLRLVSSQLPLSQSEILFSIAIPPGTSVLKIGISDFNLTRIPNSSLRANLRAFWAASANASKLTRAFARRRK